MTSLLKRTELNSEFISEILHYSDLGSTNSVAKRMVLKEKKQGFIVISKTQTSGYGQRGNFWESPSGGLWCSIAINPKINPKKIGLIPILSALCVVKALKSYNITTRLKWPNDILNSADNKKLGGILVEGKVSPGFIEYLIIGIGINVNNSPKQFSLPLRKRVTSILEISKNDISLIDLLNKIISYLEDGLFIMIRGEERQILSQWKEWDNVLGRNVKITSNNIEYEGIARDLTQFGQIILELADGREITFSSGTLTLI
ncbi:MAG: biotin--[acetyl-CoA-carboxylase] ligase [Candidatus Hodarchaeales archaeon]|jgi:BirA family biotin operon repressor/biotin-[acetyl-CoA-carboxylase] ligase